MVDIRTDGPFTEIIYKERAMCSKCYFSQMKYTGVVKLMYPPLYVHECEDCGHKENLKEMYPKFRRELELIKEETIL